MLKIKDNIDLKILENYGFKESKETYDYWDGIRRIIIYKNDKRISFNSMINKFYDILYDLIKDELIEKTLLKHHKAEIKTKAMLEKENKELKEKNASLQKEIKLMKSININDNYISKDKIREHLKRFEEIEKEFIFIDNKSTAREINKALIEFSKRLLEE